jgi:phospholipid-binding lipoprotein MlaA
MKSELVTRQGVRPANGKVQWAVLAGVLCVLGGCASSPIANPADPLEGFNRAMFGFNDTVDTVILKPTAQVYQAVLPSMVRTGVNNFFYNLGEPWVAVNAVLQGKGVAAAETMVRFGLNTFIGLGGLIDVASDLNLDRRNEDFGQTLGYWGVASGPYLVLPLFGPSTLRDSLGFVLDYQADPVTQQSNLAARDTLSAVRLVDFRASVLRAGNVLEGAALDKYSFVRDVYLQRRQSLVFDGQEPPEPQASEPAK